MRFFNRSLEQSPEATRMQGYIKDVNNLTADLVADIAEEEN